MQSGGMRVCVQVPCSVDMHMCVRVVVALRIYMYMSMRMRVGVGSEVVDVCVRVHMGLLSSEVWGVGVMMVRRNPTYTVRTSTP